MPKINELTATSSPVSTDLIPLWQNSSGAARQASISSLIAYFSANAPGAGTTGTTRTPEQYGAVGDGVTDDLAAINSALRAGTAGDRVYFTPGKTYRHSGVIGGQTTPITAGITIEGYGATLLATTPSNCAFWIQANNVTVRGLEFAVANLSGRLGSFESYRFLIKDCSGVKVHHIVVKGGPAAGIFMHNADGFLLDTPTVVDTLADGVHMSVGSRNGTVIRPTCVNVGDDGVAIVDLTQDPVGCSNINVYSPRILSQTNGRGVTIVGGKDIWYHDIYVRGSWGAGIYIGTERGDYNTRAVSNSGVRGGTLENCNYNSIDHAPIFLLTQATDSPMTDVLVDDILVDGAGKDDKPAINVKNSNSGAQYLRVRISRTRIRGNVNWLYSSTLDSQLVRNPTPYATTNGVTVDVPLWLAPQESGRTKIVTGATTIGYSATGATYLCSGSGYTVALPDAGKALNYDPEMTRKFTIFNTGTGTITVGGGGQVNGATTVSLPAKTALTFVTDGTAWWGW